MKKDLVVWCVITALLPGVNSLFAQSAEETIDWDKARQLFQKEQRGQTLTDEESAYLTRAKEVRKSGGGERPVRGNNAPPQSRQDRRPDKNP